MLDFDWIPFNVFCLSCSVKLLKCGQVWVLTETVSIVYSERIFLDREVRLV